MNLIPSSSGQYSNVYLYIAIFSHSYVVNEWLNRHCDAQIDIGIRADELGISFMDFLFYLKIYILFLFYVPFFCTAAAEVTEILNVCL
jgi:hypothetical protein